MGELFKAYRPEDVALVSFTKAAVAEVRSRLESQFGVDLSPRNGGKVSTVHSLCFNGLGLSGKVWSGADWRAFCKEAHIAITEAKVGGDGDDWEPWEPVGNAEGDVFVSWYGWARNSCLPLDEAVYAYKPPYSANFRPARMLALVDLYEAAKITSGKVDFADMLTLTLQRRLPLGARVLLVDEAQDLSVLQRRVVEMWSAEVERTWYAFDPDQAIYGFQSADPRWLIDMDAEREFLSQSWRVPRAVASLANTYIARNRSRFDHQFLPRDYEGQVVRYLDMRRLVGQIAADPAATWGLLARNVYLLSQYTSVLLEAGLPYRNLRGRSPLSRLPAGILAAFWLAQGEPVRLEELAALSRLTPAAGLWVRGAKTRLAEIAKEDPDRGVTLRNLGDMGAMDALQNALRRGETALSPLTKTPLWLRDYYQRVVRREGVEGLLREQNVTAGTIHSVKGREYDNVVLLPDWAQRTADGEEDDPEGERRVNYVAFTRARKNLYILEPVTKLWNEEIA